MLRPLTLWLKVRFLSVVMMREYYLTLTRFFSVKFAEIWSRSYHITDTYPISISTPIGDTVCASRCMLTVDITIQGRWMPASPYLLDMHDFDVILLGMDWLDKDYALLDCHRKRLSALQRRRNSIFSARDIYLAEFWSLRLRLSRC